MPKYLETNATMAARTNLKRAIGENLAAARAAENLAAARAAISTDRAAIKAALDAVNGRADAFTINDGEAVDVAWEAEKRLEASGLPKSMRAGTVVTYRPAGPTANAYKYAAKSTIITIKRNSKGWVFMQAEPSKVNPKQAEMFRIEITQEQADKVAEVALRPYAIT